MARTWLFAVLAGLVALESTSAQQPVARIVNPPSKPWQFRWHKGQSLTYRIEHVTKATETIGNSKLETSSRLNLTRRWQVESMDDHGIATLHMSVLAMRNEQVRPNGDVLLFDSAHPEQGTPGFKEQMAKYMGTTLAIVRVDGYGKVIEVIKGSATQYESDPPLVLRLPPRTPAVGQSWERIYQVTLEPPHGTGEKYPGRQTYTVTKLAEGMATIRLTTQLKLPEPVAERVPLLPKLPAGDIVFDVRSGRIQRVDLRIDQTVNGLQGEGSSYRVESSYREEYLE
jgi:hypothetical protein